MSWYELLECAGGGRQRLGETRDLDDATVAALNRELVATTRRWWTCHPPTVTGPTVTGEVLAHQLALVDQITAERDEARARVVELERRCEDLTSMRDSTVYAKTKLRAALARATPVVEAAKCWRKAQAHTALAAYSPHTTLVEAVDACEGT